MVITYQIGPSRQTYRCSALVKTDPGFGQIQTNTERLGAIVSIYELGPTRQTKCIDEHREIEVGPSR